MEKVRAGNDDPFAKLLGTGSAPSIPGVMEGMLMLHGTLNSITLLPTSVGAVAFFLFTAQLLGALTLVMGIPAVGCGLGPHVARGFAQDGVVSLQAGRAGVFRVHEAHRLGADPLLVEDPVDFGAKRLDRGTELDTALVDSARMFVRSLRTAIATGIVGSRAGRLSGGYRVTSTALCSSNRRRGRCLSVPPIGTRGW